MEEDAVVALMERSDTETDDEPLNSLDQLKNKVCGISRANLKKFLFTLMDECDALHSKNCELKDACDELKWDIRELEHENKILKNEKIELDMKVLFCMNT